MRRRCRRSKPESRASAWRGRIRIPVAMDPWFRVLPISRTGCNADLTLTPSTSTVSRRSPAATLVAIRTEPGPRWGNGSAISAEASIGHRFTPTRASLIGLRALAPSCTRQGEAPRHEPRRNLEFLDARNNAGACGLSIRASRVLPRALLWREYEARPRVGLSLAGSFSMGAPSTAALPRQLSRFVIADYARACGGHLVTANLPARFPMSRPRRSFAVAGGPLAVM